DLIPWYVNGTLREEERLSLERHLQTCLPCHSVLKQEQRVRQLLREQGEAQHLARSGRGAERLLDHIERQE
ncbi:MAG: zf-HC2 domain-containing protein, partial [Gammaproteobacteria bacterium]